MAAAFARIVPSYNAPRTRSAYANYVPHTRSISVSVAGLRQKDRLVNVGERARALADHIVQSRRRFN